MQLQYISKFKDTLKEEKEIEFLYKSVTTLELHINFILETDKASIFKVLVSNPILSLQGKMYYYNQLYSRIVLIKKTIENYREQSKIISESCLAYEKECDSWMIQIANQINSVRINSKHNDRYREDPPIQDFIKIYNLFEESTPKIEEKTICIIFSKRLFYH